ncbi:MAG: 30S ribosomal protein S27ae [Nanoarchaeota archaeon]|nr:30S ribosomal protein S27ae [Nanoarchaeota archaeon]
MPKQVKKKKVKERKGKRPHKNKLTGKKYAKYTIQGSSVTRQKSCPRCGVGVFLAINKGRLHCGKCHYTEFEKE